MSEKSSHKSGEIKYASPFSPTLPSGADGRLQWGRLYGAAESLAIAGAARSHKGLLLAVTPDVPSATRLEQELRFFLDGDDIPVFEFPDWETLPYDLFSPLPELISQRLEALHRLGGLQRGVLVVPVSTLLQRLAPRSYLDANVLLINQGDRLELDATRRRLETAGYQCVSQVFSHGEFAVRGSILDIFPMGHTVPYRIDLFDDEVDSIRTFDPESQRSVDKIDAIRMLPAREYPLNEDGIARFRRAYRIAFEGDPQRSLIYREVSNGNAPGGLEYYLPLFFEDTATLADYLPDNTLYIQLEETRDKAAEFIEQVGVRYEQRRHDVERPVLPPERIFLNEDEFAALMRQAGSITLQSSELSQRAKGFSDYVNFASGRPATVAIHARASQPAAALLTHLEKNLGRTLFVAESPGRREVLLETLQGFGIQPRLYAGWAEFIADDATLGLTVSPLERGLHLPAQGIDIIAETQLFGDQVRQERRRKTRQREAEQVVRNLTELHIGAPVVHEDCGVGRYRGLQSLDVGGIQTEFLTLEYANGDKLYVPVSSLHLISRYTGASPDQAPLHRLGGDQWEKLKKKAAERVTDVAAELLEIYARREARQGFAFPVAREEYAAFAASFPFEETPDQHKAIEAVLDDMASPRPMDRVVCGDVGFGKTEVALRAAFIAAHAGKQVAVLVPTTLLAEQHYQNFSDRFADWALRVESLSRFRNAKETKDVLAGLAAGKIDIVVGTHKLIQPDVKFKSLGLVIIDEEHRFGVRQKEKLKALRSEVDMLTLTATPIPRTLNMAMSGLRDLSIIATPPAERHPIKTFISQWNDTLVAEACQRELKRGGQVYFLHNDISTIQKTTDELAKLLPGARIQFAHGQMRERELEVIMRDFYHHRFNILVCTTIVESGIDIPTANTIIIDRADKLGLAQLHQLRGRVGRSHHRAYAYLITPPPSVMTPDAKKRLEAIESLEELGAGFTLSAHDLEIRGAGELLGDEQSGQIHEIGFTLYTELLERAVKALKAGQTPALDRPLDHGAEIDLQVPALLPSDYLPDVHSRLVLYKRIASAASSEDLRELQMEMIDRFGLLPDATKNLFAVTELKLKAQPLGIRKIEAGPQGGRILFLPEPKVEPIRIIQLIQTRQKEFKLDGNDKLRFFGDLQDSAQRPAKVAAVLDLLV